MECHCSNVKTKRVSTSAKLLLSLQVFSIFVQLIALSSAASSVEKDLTLTLSQKQALDKVK